MQPEAPVIKVMLVDDHPIVREGLRSCLITHPRIRVVAEAANATEALKKAAEFTPDVVLMDINLPGMSGVEVTRRLVLKLPGVKVVALTVHDTKEYVLKLVGCGARGYILKHSAPKELLHAIETVAAGASYFTPQVAQMVMDEYVSQAGSGSKPDSECLSARECEVLRLLSKSFSNKEIAAQMGVSIRTIETYRERIIKKLDIHTTVGLAKFAADAGLSD